MMEMDAITLRIAAEEDAEKIHSLMEQVYEQMEDPSLFVCDDLDYVRQHISKKGFTVIACAQDGSLAGTFIIRYPMKDADNLGRDIALPEEEWKHVVHMDSAVVAPAYRGRHLQAKMLRFAEEQIDRKRFSYAMATVSPNNQASYRTLEQNGYQLILTKEKYQGFLRRIYCKRLLQKKLLC
jgi:ribosomal protein S18 acetylase RimI-like enzyme